MTDRQEQWIRAQVASGDYGGDSEYFRTLIRQDQERNATFQALKEAVREGVESGVSDRTVKRSGRRRSSATKPGMADFRLSSRAAADLGGDASRGVRP